VIKIPAGLLRIDGHNLASHSPRACAGTQWKACVAPRCSLPWYSTVQYKWRRSVFLSVEHLLGRKVQRCVTPAAVTVVRTKRVQHTQNTHSRTVYNNLCSLIRRQQYWLRSLVTSTGCCRRRSSQSLNPHQCELTPWTVAGGRRAPHPSPSASQCCCSWLQPAVSTRTCYLLVGRQVPSMSLFYDYLSIAAYAQWQHQDW